MDARSGVLPDGIPEAVPATEHASFFTDPHHNFLYGDGGALKYTMSPTYPTEYITFAPQVDANTHHSFPQSYAPQNNLRPPQSQSHFDTFPPQHLQLVRQSPSTISPAQLQPQPYHPQINWDELSTYQNGSDHPPVQGLPSPQVPLDNTGKPHRTTVIAPPADNGTQWMIANSTNLNNPLQNSHTLGIASANGTLLPGCYWCTVEPETTVPEEWTGRFHPTLFV